MGVLRCGEVVVGEGVVWGKERRAEVSIGWRWIIGFVDVVVVVEDIFGEESVFLFLERREKGKMTLEIWLSDSFDEANSDRHVRSIGTSIYLCSILMRVRIQDKHDINSEKRFSHFPDGVT